MGGQRRRHHGPVQRRRYMVEVGLLGRARVRHPGPDDVAQVPRVDGVHRKPSVGVHEASAQRPASLDRGQHPGSRWSPVETGRLGQGAFMSDTEYHSWWHKEVGLIRMILFGISCWLVL